MNEESIKKVFHAIHSRREHEYMTQKELAQLIHIAPPRLSLKLNGKAQFRLDELDEISLILHCSVTDLVEGKTEDDENTIPGVYTVDEIAKLLNKSRDQVLDLIHTGRLKAIQPIDLLITRRSYEKYINAI